VRSLLASCLDCYHEATINVDQQPGHLAVPSFAGRMKCTKCEYQARAGHASVGHQSGSAMTREPSFWPWLLVPGIGLAIIIALYLRVW
jgi:hypothetical protein